MIFLLLGIPEREEKSTARGWDKARTTSTSLGGRKNRRHFD